jgi:acyl-CoA dehydrogenase
MMNLCPEERKEVEPLDFVLGHPYDVRDPQRNALVRPLQAEVKKHKLWACHLGPELGGQGYGQVKLALMNEILGGSRFAPIVTAVAIFFCYCRSA